MKISTRTTLTNIQLYQRKEVNKGEKVPKCRHFAIYMQKWEDEIENITVIKDSWMHLQTNYISASQGHIKEHWSLSIRNYLFQIQKKVSERCRNYYNTHSDISECWFKWNKIKCNLFSGRKFFHWRSEVKLYILDSKFSLNLPHSDTALLKWTAAEEKILFIAKVCEKHVLNFTQK